MVAGTIVNVIVVAAIPLASVVLVVPVVFGAH